MKRSEEDTLWKPRLSHRADFSFASAVGVKLIPEIEAKAVQYEGGYPRHLCGTAVM